MAYANELQGTIALWNNDKQTSENSPIVTGNITIPVDLLTEIFERGELPRDADGNQVITLRVAIWEFTTKQGMERSDKAPLYKGKVSQILSKDNLPARTPAKSALKLKA